MGIFGRVDYCVDRSRHLNNNLLLYGTSIMKKTIAYISAVSREEILESTRRN